MTERRRVRVCICGVPGCLRHGSRAWGRIPPGRAAAYADPVYQANRKVAIDREPVCHWRLEGCTGKSITADHLVPVARGGSGALDNLVGACASCNRRRGAAEGHATMKARAKQRWR